MREFEVTFVKADRLNAMGDGEEETVDGLGGGRVLSPSGETAHTDVTQQTAGHPVSTGMRVEMMGESRRWGVFCVVLCCECSAGPP